MTTSYAWTVIPGTVHVPPLDATQTEKDQWVLGADRATGVIDLQGLRQPLGRRTWSARGSASGTGSRVPPGTVARETLPPIKGLENPPDPAPERPCYPRGNPETGNRSPRGPGSRVEGLWLEDYGYHRRRRGARRVAGPRWGEHRREGRAELRGRRGRPRGGAGRRRVPRRGLGDNRPPPAGDGDRAGRGSGS